MMLLCCGIPQASAALHNATTDFSITNGNPNGVWTYGYQSTGGSTFIPYTQNGTTPVVLYWAGWIAGDGNPSLGKNISGSTINGVGPGQLYVHPGPSGQPSIFRWTAPAGVASSVHVEGQFFAGDIGVMKVAITLNNDWVTKLFQATDAGVFSFDQAVSPGDTIDFAVYDGFGYGSTPLDARISYGSTSTVPEPSSLGIASLLAIGAGVRRRRHR